ncbi:MAG: flagellar filament capping protein FliD [Rickettsiales bacterium]
MTSINLGTIVNKNGKTSASGIASGLDSAGLIQGMLSARQSSVDGKKDTIDVNLKKVSAVDDFNLRLDRFKSSLNVLRNEPGVGNKNNFLFNYRTTSLTSDNGVSASSYLDVTAKPGASINSYEISDVKLAKSHTISLSGFSSKTASVVSGNTVAGRFTTVSANTPLAGTALDTASPILFHAQGGDANTTFTSTLAGALSDLQANFVPGESDGAGGFTPNKVRFTVTVGGQAYTSQAVELSGGSADGDNDGSGDLGVGQNGYGNAVAAGTELVFTKDVDSDPTAGTTDVSFGLKVGGAVTIDGQTDANGFASSVSSFLSDNGIKIAQDFDSAVDDPADVVSASPAVGFRAGTFSLGGVSVTIKEGDSLSSIKSKINATSETSGVRAEIFQIGEGNFTLQLKSTKTGVDGKIGEYGDGDVGDPASGLLKFGGGNVAFHQDKAAADASFVFNGATVTRKTNEINDLISDVTFTLKGDSPANTTISANVEPDVDSIYTGVADALNAYNDVKFFVSSQTQKDASGNYTKEAVLGGDNVLKETMRDLETQFTSLVKGVSGSSGIFSVGVDFKDYPGDTTLLPTRDIFTLDENTFKTALKANFTDVQKVFAYDLASDSSELSVYKRSNDATLTNFKLNIDETRADGQKVRVLDKNDNFLFYADYEQKKDSYGNVVGTGGKIVGPAGSALAGTELIYSGDGSDDISVNATQGVADRTYNLLNGLLDEKNGTLANKVTELKDKNADLQKKVDKDSASIEKERTMLVKKFAMLEQAVSKANSILAMFQAQQDVNTANN